jgi:hypothetical protein
MQPTQTGAQGAPTTPTDQSPQGAPTMPTGQQDWREVRAQQRVERHAENQVAGIPVWGVLLIVLGVVALFGNFGIGIGWVFGLALGAFFVYLGVRHVQEGKPVNWWLVGLGLLIGLGAATSGLAWADEIIFPIVLVVVGVGLLAEHFWNRDRQAI